jgi:hypothetical protein
VIRMGSNCHSSLLSIYRRHSDLGCGRLFTLSFIRASCRSSRKLWKQWPSCSEPTGLAVIAWIMICADFLAGTNARESGS